MYVFWMFQCMYCHVRLWTVVVRCCTKKLFHVSNFPTVDVRYDLVYYLVMILMYVQFRFQRLLSQSPAPQIQAEP
jgi:hypothetical protein